jgi:protein gp37
MRRCHAYRQPFAKELTSMAGVSDIEWTDATWNPIVGCSMVSPGCTNCYAMRMAARLESMGIDKYNGTTRKSGTRHIWTGRIRLDEKSLSIPLRWRKPRLIFVNSMSDLFHEKVPFTFIHRVWDVMENSGNHKFQVLTKRPGRMVEFVRERKVVPKNVWLGTSVESPEHLSRIDEIRELPGPVRFISFEPLLARIMQPKLRNIDWIIVGGESGPGARPIDEAWALELLEAAKWFNAAFFFKQWGGPVKKKAGRVLVGRTWNELPNG